MITIKDWLKKNKITGKIYTTWMAKRTRTQPITTIVLHATAGGSLVGAITTLYKKKFSYHFLIDKDGTEIKGVPYNDVAFHAGESTGPNGRYCNGYSIGISFVNKNDGKDPYTWEQYLACERIIHELLTKDMKVKATCKWLTTHYWISPGRKTDPKNFDVERIAKATGLTIWKPK